MQEENLLLVQTSNTYFKYNEDYLTFNQPFFRQNKREIKTKSKDMIGTIKSNMNSVTQTQMTSWLKIPQPLNLCWLPIELNLTTSKVSMKTKKVLSCMKDNNSLRNKNYWNNRRRMKRDYGHCSRSTWEDNKYWRTGKWRDNRGM